MSSVCRWFKFHPDDNLRLSAGWRRDKTSPVALPRGYVVSLPEAFAGSDATMPYKQTPTPQFGTYTSNRTGTKRCVASLLRMHAWCSRVWNAARQKAPTVLTTLG